MIVQKLIQKIFIISLLIFLLTGFANSSKGKGKGKSKGKSGKSKDSGSSTSTTTCGCTYLGSSDVPDSSRTSWSCSGNSASAT